MRETAGERTGTVWHASISRDEMSLGLVEAAAVLDKDESSVLAPTARCMRERWGGKLVEGAAVVDKLDSCGELMEATRFVWWPCYTHKQYPES